MQTAENTRKARIVILHQEMDAVHLANKLYWNQGLEAARETRAEYHQRQDRLDEIRSELVLLRSPEPSWLH